MLTAWCFAVAFFTPWVVGAPVYWLMRGGRALRGPDWLWVPFIGLAAIVVPLQNVTVYANLPLARSVPWYWAGFGALLTLFIAHPAGRASLRAIPKRVVLLSTTAYLLLGSGALLRGIENYRGQLQSDQFNYVVLAQYLMDEPFGMTWPQIGERPVVAIAMTFKGDRLGQSVLHGFFALTAGRDALEMFFPTIFLLAALSVPAVRLLAPRVGLFGRTAGLSALVCALAPGANILATLSYLSHALFIPVLVAFVAAVGQAARRPRMQVHVCVLFVLGFALYTEFAPLMAGAAGAAALAARLSGRIGWGRAAALVVVPMLALLVNPAACASAAAVAERAGQLGKQIEWGWLPITNVLTAPWSIHTHPSVRWSQLWFPCVCYSLSYVGWVRVWRAGHNVAEFGAVTALMVVPFVLVAVNPSAKYAVWKALSTTAPLFALGVCVLPPARR